MKLIFVYNANSGAINSLLDSVHKIVSPATYDCNLCAITFGNFREDELWKAFREHSEHTMVFLHKDEFEKEYASKWLPKYDFPIVLIATNAGLEIFLTSKEIASLETSEALIERINQRSAHY